MSKVIKIKQGLDIKLKGAADKVMGTAASKTYAIRPDDFHGVFSKVTVKVGDQVKAGEVIAFDKYQDKVKFCAPVSGEIVEIIRGEKRKLLEVRILADSTIAYASLVADDSSKESVISSLCNAGLWPFIKQRPYDVIANPEETPRDIFISGFNTAPLGADMDYVLHGREAGFQKGLDALSKLTGGKVFLSVHAKRTASDVLKGAKNVEMVTVDGPHPSGLAGMQINSVQPINKGERVWTVDAQAIAMMGEFFISKKAEYTKVIAVGGAQVAKPKYYRTTMGIELSALLKESEADTNEARVINGDALTGVADAADSHLRFYNNEVSVIPEGGDSPMFGWIAPNFNKLSMSRTMFSWLTPNKEYNLSTNTNGEERPFVITGTYEQVFPMDVYPMQLLKAIMVKDIEQMENLGIYEVIPEDFALCEFVDPSKINMQQVVREGLDLAHSELG